MEAASSESPPGQVQPNSSPKLAPKRHRCLTCLSRKVGEAKLHSFVEEIRAFDNRVRLSVTVKVIRVSGAADWILNADGQSSQSSSACTTLEEMEFADQHTIGTPSEGDSSIESSEVSESTLPSQSLSIPWETLLRPLVDSYLKNIHPICCNNFLHNGTFCEAVDCGKVPKLLLLVLCGVSAKFIPNRPEVHEYGRKWLAEAKACVFQSLDYISTLHVAVLQFLALNEIHEGNFARAWNLLGLSMRIALKLRLNIAPTSTDWENVNRDHSVFIQLECHIRLMWCVFISNTLLACEELEYNENLVEELPLPCNAWNFFQGFPCKTLRLSDTATDTEAGNVTNPCAYLIKIILIRKRILRYIFSSPKDHRELPWQNGSTFQALSQALEEWRCSLGDSYTFEVRHIYNFRSSLQLDMFLMIHIWYHHCYSELYGFYMPGHHRAVVDDHTLSEPSEFIGDCTARSVSHAREISRIIGEVLKVEPDHLFRDVWFGFCVLDSTRVQIAAALKQPTSESRDELGSLLKLNIQALENTKNTFRVTEKIYQECCNAIHRAGLDELVKDDVSPDIGYADLSNPPNPIPKQYAHSPTVGICRLYPFLEASRPGYIQTWDNLFSATRYAEPRNVNVPNNTGGSDQPSASTASLPKPVWDDTGQHQMSWLNRQPPFWVAEGINDYSRFTPASGGVNSIAFPEPSASTTSTTHFGEDYFIDLMRGSLQSSPF
ncbi:MAG: hypothetical protein M1834_008458 [Cirrosporium novae-zelandiae]|nr:MAG: hypothetical protein M1834_008458 [Cirrosporium novae-zelandiae]